MLGALDPDAINSTLQQHSASLAKTEKGLSELDGKVGEMSAQLSEFMEKVKVLEVCVGGERREGGR